MEQSRETLDINMCALSYLNTHPYPHTCHIALGEQVDIVFIIPIHSLNIIQLLLPYSLLQSFKREKKVFQCWRCLPSDVRNGVRVSRGLASAPAALAPCITSCMFAPGWMHYLMGSLLLLSSGDLRKVSGKHKTRGQKERAAQAGL